jgi:hypothetical protein
MIAKHISTALRGETHYSLQAYLLLAVLALHLFENLLNFNRHPSA